ncbi:MAG TPA: transglycosylase family protein [Cellulomonas sp.]
MLPIAAGTLALALGGGSAAFAAAHKTVTLDVDGVPTSVSTFAGSVAGLLADEHVTVGTRDLVAPNGPLADGSEVVVRHAHLVTVARDGAQQAVWTTALTADEALADLATRDGAMPSLVVSRSGDRATMPLHLTLTGPADVIADGRTRTVPDGATDVASALAALGITLQPLDEVSVTRTAGGRVQVVVQRVAVQDVTTSSEVPFGTQTVKDAAAYRGTKTVRQAGVAGVRTLVERVTVVDGVQTARVTVSDTSTAPVDQVVAVGTKAKPAAAAGSSSPAAAVSGDVDSLNWAALAGCESGGRVDAVSRNGLYYGLYQFSTGTWRAVGGSGLPSQASADEQTARAKALYARSGAGQWPVCGKNLFS